MHYQGGIAPDLGVQSLTQGVTPPENIFRQNQGVTPPENIFSAKSRLCRQIVFVVSKT
jgi:hypothetical protein